MAISTNGGSNPTYVNYNGITVNEVKYNGVHVWPDIIGVFYKVDGDTIYLRGTPKDGYSQ